MTGTDKIKSKIMEDAKAKALQTEEQAKAEAGDIIDQAKREAALKEAEILKKAESDGMDLYKRMLAVAELEGRKSILGAKQDMISLAFKTAMEKLCALPDNEYQRLIEDMTVKSAITGEGEILLSEKDAKRMDAGFIENINRRLENSGKSGKLSLSAKTVRTAGGFILKYGDMEINSTFEILFGVIRPELEQEVVKILFGD
ncbi:MAG: V-type ATP synthase subunit E [Bacillota bacterium]